MLDSFGNPRFVTARAVFVVALGIVGCGGTTSVPEQEAHPPSTNESNAAVARVCGSAQRGPDCAADE